MSIDKVLIQLNNATFGYQGEDLLFEDIKITVKKGDKTAIVGINGAGKSTLLKILTGQIKIEQGDLTIDCKPYYVPQIDLSVNDKNLYTYDYISKYYDEWWEVPSEVEKIFNITINTEDLVKNLSGGELMKLNLSIALKQNPDVLILDEPTNHLDVKSIKTLIDFINSDQGKKYTYLIVSHDVFFMNSVINKVWELDDKKISTYGGNYDFYVEQKELQLRGIKRQYDIAKAQLERAKEQEQKQIQRQAEKANQAKRAFIKGSIDKTEYSEGKMSSGSSERTINLQLEKLQEQAVEKLEELESEERKLAFIQIKNTKDNYGRTIFDIKDATLKIKDLVLINDINLKADYGDRMVIAGDNGSGKTTFIKSLLKNAINFENSQNIWLEGDINMGKKMNWVYIDQNYSLIKPDLNLIQNLLQYNHLITEDIAKEQLGKFKFKTKSELSKLGKSLSGGEMVRLVMAMITSNPVDMLVMDEPTNNLDVATVEVLTESLNAYKGGLIVISHNIEFLNKINIKKAYIIKNKKINIMNVEPSQKEDFYKELIS